MFQVLRNAWKIADLRKKILYTLLIILIFRIGSYVSVPFVDMEVMKNAVASNAGGYMDYLTLLSGGGFSNASIFALSITPYINASIIIQLLTVAIPPLERMAKDGEAGRKKLGQITRYVTGGLGLMLGVAYYFMVRNKYGALASEAKTGGAAWFAAIVIVLCFTAGSALMMWLGEQINEKGIGNGISILLFAGIISRLPTALNFLWKLFYDSGIKILDQGGGAAVKNMVLVPIIVILFLAIVGFIVFLTDAERRIPVQYAKRVVGRKMYGGQSTHIPIKVNMSGVMPIIFAQSIASLPATIGAFAGWTLESQGFGGGLMRLFDTTKPFYSVLYFLLIVGFSYFYATMQFNPIEVANNLKKNGGFIPGFRPGKPTADFILKVLNKITMFGALYLSVIAIAPIITGNLFGYSSLAIGGTSVIIVVGVALETVKQMEAQMLMRHYKGFLE